MTPAFLVAEQNGIYKAPDELATLRRAARDAGLAWHVIDLQRARGKRALFTAFACEFAFPATFGGNWDALADCLQDLSWRTASGSIVQIRGATVFAHAAADDYATMRAILDASAQYWGGRRRIFTVLTDDAGDRPVPAQ